MNRLPRIRHHLKFATLLLIAISCTSYADDDYENCGTLENHYGPFDYYSPANHTSGPGARSKISIVEVRHLTPGMLQLKKGSTAVQIRQDLDYTLRAVPNHPAALDLASRFEDRRRDSTMFAKAQKPLYLSANCYFKRAIMLTPNNGTVWMLYALHAHRQGRLNAAVERYRRAEALNLDSAVFHYNFGLTLLDVNDLEGAREHAERAAELGYPLEGLKKRLADRGVSVGDG